MTTAEIQEIERSIPFSIQENMEDITAGAAFTLLRWAVGSKDSIPPYWSMARDRWLREFVYTNGPMKNAVNTFVNKLATIPWTIQPIDRSIDRHVRNATMLEKTMRRFSGSMSSGPLRGFKATLKMFTKDYLTQDNGAFMVVLGDGRADGPIVGAPSGLMHLDASLCIRTRDDEFPVKFLNSGRGGDNKEYKLHYTRVIEMVNLPSTEIELNGIGLCPVSCCLEAAQELYDIYQYNREMFGSKPPRQVLYAKKGASVKTMTDAIAAWQQKIESDNRTHFGGTLVMAPRTMGLEMELDVLDLARMPEDFNRRDVTTIDKSEIAAAFGLDLRDLAYTMGAPSRTGDAEVQDRKGRGKGIGEFIETFQERMGEVYLNSDLFHMRFDNIDDEQDEQEAIIRDKRSAGRERDLSSGVVTIRVVRENMWADNEISYDQFCDMELESGRLPDGLDVLLLFQSEDGDYRAWLDVGVSDPTNVMENDPLEMTDTIHEKYIEVSRIIHEESRTERRRKARQALAALTKLRAMYEVSQISQVDPTTGEAIQTLPAQGGNQASSESGATNGVAQPKPETAAPARPVATKEISMDDPDLRAYERQFRYLIEQALEGQVSRERFEGAMEQIVIAILMTLFARGSYLTVSELSVEIQQVLDTEIQVHLSALDSFADDLFDPVALSGNRIVFLSSALERVSKWLTIASGIYYLGMLYRTDDPYLQWNYSIFKEHCADCLRLNGQVHTASEWRATIWRPRSSVLECFGVHCGCFLTQVNGPSTGAF